MFLTLHTGTGLCWEVALCVLQCMIQITILHWARQLHHGCDTDCPTLAP